MTMMILNRLVIFHVSLIFVISFAKAKTTVDFPEVTSYAKVSRIGSDVSTDPKPSSTDLKNQGRSYHASPIYVPAKISQLKNGEAYDHPSTEKYSTLDKELLDQLDGRKLSNQHAQDRFHPPAYFEFSKAHSNAAKQNNAVSPLPITPSTSSDSSPSSDYATLPKQIIYGDDYGYPAVKPAKDELPSITMESYGPDSSYSQPPDSYGPQMMMPYRGPEKLPSYLEKFPSKPDFQTYFENSSPPDHDSDHFHYDHDEEYPHDLIYDHPPDHFDDHTTTTQEPEMMDQRLSKRPYSYYYIGKKLWYIPLYFSIYFIIYIAALILKSVARHKINFPSTLADAVNSRTIKNSPGWWDLTRRVLEAIDKFSTHKTA